MHGRGSEDVSANNREMDDLTTQGAFNGGVACINELRNTRKMVTNIFSTAQVDGVDGHVGFADRALHNGWMMIMVEKANLRALQLAI